MLAAAISQNFVQLIHPFHMCRRVRQITISTTTLSIHQVPSMPIHATTLGSSHDLIQPPKLPDQPSLHIYTCPDAEMQIPRKARLTMRARQMTESCHILAASEDTVDLDVAS